MPIKPKKPIYLFCCVILGILLSFILHTLIELPIIFIMVKDMQKYSFGLTWNELMLIHRLFTAITILGGAVFGYWIGRKWWKYVYLGQ